MLHERRQSGNPTIVDMQHFAGDEACRFQEQNGIGDILNLPIRPGG
jgi:hypothetical protein